MSRSKDQWIEETGGFRLGESDEEFKRRCARIAELKARVEAGRASMKDVNELARLRGQDNSDE